VSSLFISSWDLRVAEKRSVVWGRLQGREPQKSSLVNSYCSSLIFDFWKGTVTHEIVELPLKDFVYRYS